MARKALIQQITIQKSSLKKENTISPVNAFDKKQSNSNANQTAPPPQDQDIFYRIGQQSPQQHQRSDEKTSISPVLCKISTTYYKFRAITICTSMSNRTVYRGAETQCQGEKNQQMFMLI